MIRQNIWPAYIPPKKNELLSSWLFRTSLEHQIKPYSFTLFYFEDCSIWSRDIDKYFSENNICLLEKYTPLSRNQIKMMQLSSYENILYVGELTPSYTEGLTNIGIYHRKRTQNGLLACPSCLKKDAYYKKEWRLLSSLICVNCNSYLIDSCPQCGSPIIFQRLAIGDKANYQEYPIYLCWKCHYDFRKINLPIIKNNLILEYQQYINHTIDNGFNDRSQYSFLYFKILFSILNKTKANSKLWNRVRNAFIDEFEIGSFDFNIPDVYKSLQYRIKVLPLVYSLFKNWPIDFIYFCKKHQIRYSDLSKNSLQPIPYWVYCIFKEYY